MNIKQLFADAKEGKAAKIEVTLATESPEEKAMRLEEKANEVMHTTNTAAGAEFIPDEVFAQGIIDIVPDRSRLLPLLPGNHGVGLPKAYTSATVALSTGDLEFEGKTEWTTGTASETEDDHSQQKATTSQITLNQKGFIAEIDISDDQLKYNAVNTEKYVKERLALGMAYTVDALIINGDSETGATGNVNSDDGAPTATKYYLKNDGGIRERGINGSYSYNAGTLAASDYSELLSVMGEYGIDPEDILFIQSPKVTHKTRTLDELETVDKMGANATIVKGMVGSIYGSPVISHRAVPLTEADGKVSATPSNNTLGQICALYAPAVQYGFGQDLLIEIVRNPGYGYRVVATFDFAFKIVDSEDSLDNPTVAVGYNITV